MAKQILYPYSCYQGNVWYLPGFATSLILSSPYTNYHLMIFINNVKEIFQERKRYPEY